MDLPINRFKHAIQSGQKQIGLWSHLCSNISTEILAHCGYDWLLLDMEHSPNEVGTILSQLQAAGSALGLPDTVMMFEPQPQEFFQRDQAPVERGECQRLECEVVPFPARDLGRQAEGVGHSVGVYARRLLDVELPPSLCAAMPGPVAGIEAVPDWTETAKFALGDARLRIERPAGAGH